MRLLPCNQPNGSLESAPRTALCTDSRDERWEGFWCDADEQYYALCVQSDGGAQWYRISDGEQRAAEPVAKTRVLPLRRRDASASAVNRMLLLWSGSGRPILVGTRAARSRSRAGRGGRRGER